MPHTHEEPNMKKPSELFEGEDSSLRKTFDAAVKSNPHEELREQWNRTIPKPLPNAEIEKFAATVADWWLQKFSEREQAVREKIEGIREFRKPHKMENVDKFYSKRVQHNKTIKVVLKLFNQ